MPSLVHSTFSMVNWISFVAGISFQVLRKVFFSIFPEQILMRKKQQDNYGFTVLAEEDVNWSNTGKIEDIDAVLDCDLDIGQWVHLLHWASARHRNRNVQALSSVQHRNIERLQERRIVRMLAAVSD